MPELPEVESIRRQLDPELAGRTVTELWWDPHPALPRQFHHVELLRGRKIAAVGRRGKFLICPLDRDLELVMHLGMTGSFSFTARDRRADRSFSARDRRADRSFSARDRRADRSLPVDAHARAKLSLDDGRSLTFRDPRRFGRLAVVTSGEYEALPSLAALGPEPLSDDFEPDRFAAAVTRTRAPIKPFLLSQRPVAGVGNIYADEALWLARIHPASRTVSPRKARALHASIREVLWAAIAREGTTFRDYVMVSGDRGGNAGFLIAYGRGGEPCPRCGRRLRKMMLAGRGTTYCPRCQRR